MRLRLARQRNLEDAGPPDGAVSARSSSPRVAAWRTPSRRRRRAPTRSTCCGVKSTRSRAAAGAAPATSRPSKIVPPPSLPTMSCSRGRGSPAPRRSDPASCRSGEVAEEQSRHRSSADAGRPGRPARCRCAVAIVPSIPARPRLACTVIFLPGTRPIGLADQPGSAEHEPVVRPGRAPDGVHEDAAGDGLAHGGEFGPGDRRASSIGAAASCRIVGAGAVGLVMTQRPSHSRAAGVPDATMRRLGGDDRAGEFSARGVRGCTARAGGGDDDGVHVVALDEGGNLAAQGRVAEDDDALDAAAEVGRPAAARGRPTTRLGPNRAPLDTSASRGQSPAGQAASASGPAARPATTTVRGPAGIVPAAVPPPRCGFFDRRPRRRPARCLRERDRGRERFAEGRG